MTTSDVIQKTVNETFEPQNIARVATQKGYNIDADFEPQGFADFTSEVVTIVFAKVMESLKVKGLYRPDEKEELKQRVSLLVTQNLKAVCHCVPQNLDFPEPSRGLLGWLWRWLFPQK